MEGYDIERIVGEGSYGKAILAKNKKDSKKVIIKVSSYHYIIIITILILIVNSKSISRNYHQEKYYMLSRKFRY